MPCTVVKIGGSAGIVCSRSGRAKACEWCRSSHRFLCDHVMPNGKTCDRRMCASHARQLGPDRHACPEHEPGAA